MDRIVEVGSWLRPTQVTLLSDPRSAQVSVALSRRPTRACFRAIGLGELTKLGVRRGRVNGRLIGVLADGHGNTYHVSCVPPPHHLAPVSGDDELAQAKTARVRGADYDLQIPLRQSV